MVHNYSVVSKGIYTHEQTSDLLNVKRFLIVRKKKRRFLLLDMCNNSNETLTAIRLEVEQFDVRGNSLGVAVGEFKKLSYKHGGFILKDVIELKSACIDFRIRVVYAEYGNYVYRLGEEGTYVTYEKKKSMPKLDAYSMRKKTGKQGFVSAPRRFKFPVFVSVFASLIMAISAVLAVGHVFWFKKTGDEFFLSNLKYAYVTEDKSDDAPVYITGYVGRAGEDITIPNKVEGHPVRGIVDYAFADNDIIKTLTVEEGVTISSSAFQNCQNLSSVTLKGKNIINSNAFAYCYNLSSVTAVDLVSIGDNAFKDISKISTLRITSTSADETTLRIAYSAFSGCEEFGELYIDDFLYYMSGSNYFPDTKEVETLYLKNFNYSDYVESQADGRLQMIFGGNNLKVKTVEIGYMDSIPANFMKGCGKKLTSFTVRYLKNAAVGDNAFNGCKKLKDVSMPTLLAKVGDYAFKETALESFDARALEVMGVGAFENCDQLASFILSSNNKLATIPALAFNDCEALTAIILPNSITGIGESAFADCPMLGSVLFQDNELLTEIGDNAFQRCTSLYSMVLPDAVTNIGEQAFAQCKNLHYISLPKTLESIAKNAFYKCYKLFEIQNLSNVSISAGTDLGFYTLKVYNAAEEERIPKESIDGFNFARVENIWVLLEYVGTEKEIVTPETVNGEEYIAWSYMFIEDAGIEKISFSSGAVYLGVEMFKDSTVKEIAFKGNNILNWSIETFQDATNVTTLNFGSREFSNVPTNAFSTLSSLKYITLPEEVKTIDTRAFENCQSLQNVYGGQGVISIGAYAFLNCYNLESYDFGASLQSIEEYAFYDCRSLKSFDGAYRLERIGNNAFENCDSLQSASFANTLLSIDFAAFNSCDSLNKVNGGRGLAYVGDNAFSYCTSLQSIALYSTVSYLGSYAFYQCTALRSVSLPNSINEIQQNTFAGCSALQSVSGGEGVETIGAEAFLDCTSLMSYDIPSSVVNIDMNAFRNCTSLTTVTAGSSLQRIYEYAFADCSKLTTISFNKSLQKIYDNAFNNCTSLKSVTLPSSLTDVGNYAFQNCTAMTLLTTNGSLQQIGDGAFENCRSLYTINFAEGLIHIGSFAFCNCSSLRRVTLPSTLQTIGSAAFQQCSGMTSVTMSGDLYEIADSAFANCTSLSSVTFAEGITGIGSYAFSGCTSLRSVQLPTKLTNISYGAFINCTALEKIWLPANLWSIYGDAFTGCDNLHEVYNFSNLNILKDSTSYGRVAYNALVVYTDDSQSLYKTTVGDFVFKYSLDYSICALVDYNGSATTLNLDNMLVDGYTVDSYEIARYAFKGSTALQAITIGSAVKDIRSYAFTKMNNLQSVKFNQSMLSLKDYVFTECYSLKYIIIPTTLQAISSYTFEGDYEYIAYYEGSRNEFYDNSGSSRYSLGWNSSFYYYDACIHYDSEWNYDSNGRINTEIKPLAVETITQEATCRKDGIKVYSCLTCQDTETETLWALGHQYEDSECSRCGYVNNMYVTGNNLHHAQEFLTFTNDKENPFDLFDRSRNRIYSTAGRNSTSTLTITAKTDLDISFMAACEGAEAMMLISVNGREYKIMEDSVGYSFTVEKGSSITIQYVDMREPLPEPPVTDETTSDTSDSSASEDVSEDVIEDVAQVCSLRDIRITSTYEPV